MKHLQDENSALKQELSIEKEKLHTLEAAFENMRKQGLFNCHVMLWIAWMFIHFI